MYIELGTPPPPPTTLEKNFCGLGEQVFHRSYAIQTPSENWRKPIAIMDKLWPTSLQCLDTAGWASGRASSLQPAKIEWRCWCQIICIWFSWCHFHPKTPSSLVSFKSRLVLPFWYQLTQVVMEKRPLNRCSSNSSCDPLTWDKLIVGDVVWMCWLVGSNSFTSDWLETSDRTASSAWTQSAAFTSAMSSMLSKLCTIHTHHNHYTTRLPILIDEQIRDSVHHYMR